MSSKVDSVGHQSWFTPDEHAELMSLGRACAPHVASIVTSVRAELHVAYPFLEQAPLAPIDALRAALTAALSADTRALADLVEELARRLAERSADLLPLYGVLERARRRVTTLVVAQQASTPEVLVTTLAAMQRCFDRCLQTIGARYLRRRDEERRTEQRSKDAALLRFRRLSEAGVLGIIVCDYDGNIREANNAFLEMVGYTSHEVLSGQLRWTDMTPPEWRWLDDQAVIQLRALGQSMLWEKEYFRKDGSRVPILVAVATLSANEVLAFVLDISERKDAEELRTRSVQLEAENHRIQEASRLKSEFLANMSHELRTPLNSIIGFADLLHGGDVHPSAPEYREFLGDILNSGRHLLRLINDILDLAKIEAGKLTFHAEQVRLSQLVGESIDVLRIAAQKSGLTVDVTLDPDVEQVHIDPARFKQVLYNYLSNALKFTPSGGRVHVRTLATDPETFTLEVEDTGIGIRPEDRARLFTEFEQLDYGTTKRHGGTGLGLALTKRIVEAQGGSVRVESEVGRGSCFAATFSRRQAAPAPASSASLAEQDDVRRMLVVDGQDHDGRELARTLEASGYDVTVARTGSQAIAACRTRRFDAITLDLVLPDLTGLEVIHRVRAEGLNQQTPLIVISQNKERAAAATYPVSAFLSKPVGGRALLDSLARAGVSPGRMGTVMVVDDDPASLRLMETTLQRLGYTVRAYGEAESALAAARANACDAVVLDLVMPNIDGFEFLQRFRALPAHRCTPVIVWTTKDLSSDDHQRLRSTAQAVFDKGHGRPLRLVDALQSLLRARSRGGAAASDA